MSPIFLVFIWKLFVTQTGLYLIYRLIPLPNADRLSSAGRSLQVPPGQLRRITPGSSGAVPATVLLRLPAADRRVHSRGFGGSPVKWPEGNRQPNGSARDGPEPVAGNFYPPAIVSSPHNGPERRRRPILPGDRPLWRRPWSAPPDPAGGAPGQCRPLISPGGIHPGNRQRIAGAHSRAQAPGLATTGREPVAGQKRLGRPETVVGYFYPSAIPSSHHRGSQRRKRALRTRWPSAPRKLPWPASRNTTGKLSGRIRPRNR